MECMPLKQIELHKNISKVNKKVLAKTHLLSLFQAIIMISLYNITVKSEYKLAVWAIHKLILNSIKWGP